MSAHTTATEFDTNRVPSQGSRGRRSLNRPPLDLAQASFQLAQQLQTSLETERLLNLFFSGIQRWLGIEALIYQHASSDLFLQLGEQTAHSCQYRLTHEGQSLGLLQLYGSLPLSAQERCDLEALLTCLLYPLRNALLYRSATQSALRDPLTGAGNRLAMEQILEREAEVARRHRQPLSLLMLDVDFFKRINDTYGHLNGDEVLVTIVHLLKVQLRNIDRVFRFGGEEFVVVMSDTDSEAAAQIGERLRLAVQALTFAQMPDLPLSISLGCATLQPAESVDHLLLRVDNALYGAKREGRNCMKMAG